MMEKDSKGHESSRHHGTGVSRRAFIRGAVAGAALYAEGPIRHEKAVGN